MRSSATATRASSASTRTGTASAATPRPGYAWPRTAAPTSSRSPSACSEGGAAAGGALPPAAPSCGRGAQLRPLPIADQMEHEFAPVRRGPVLVEVDPLPGPEHGTAVPHRDRELGLRERRAE